MRTNFDWVGKMREPSAHRVEAISFPGRLRCTTGVLVRFALIWLLLSVSIVPAAGVTPSWADEPNNPDAYHLVFLPVIVKGQAVLPPVITRFVATPGEINAGESTVLLWRVSNPVDTLILEPGAVDVNGLTMMEVSPTETTTYLLTAQNSAGSSTAQVVVTVGPPHITSFTASPAVISPGQSAMLSWSIAGQVTSLVLNPGNLDVTGQTNTTVSPNQTTTYTLTAQNSMGSSSAHLVVTVSTGPVITSFTATPSLIDPGQETTLSWTVGNPFQSLILNPGNIDVTGQASVTVAPGGTTTYRLTASSETGTASAETVVTVNTTGQPLELVVFDWNQPVIKDDPDHGFAWQAPPRSSANGNWFNPLDYANGTLYFRAEIRSMPVTKQMKLQFCIEQNDGALLECGPAADVSGAPGTVVTWSANVQELWEKSGKPINWSLARSKVLAVVRNKHDHPVTDLDGYNWSGENPDEWFPLDMRFTAVVVAEGAAFSNWEDHLRQTQLLIFDWNQQVTTADHGTAWEEPPRPAASADWTLPTNYAEGELQFRAEIRSMPVTKQMKLQLCIEQNAGALQECGPLATVSGASGTVVTWSANVQDLWEKGGKPIDWSKARSRLYVVIKNKAGDWVTDLDGLNWSGEDPAAWYPLDMRFTTVVVAKGATFTGWEDYIIPTPTPTPSPTPTDTTTDDELLVFDWNRELPKTLHGFAKDKPPMASANGDWTYPRNFAEGTLHFRAEIRNQPVPQEMKLQFCFWQYTNDREACGPKADVPGTSGTVVTWSVSMQDLWELNGVPINWQDPRYANGVSVKNKYGNPVSDLNDWNWSGENPDEWYPLDFRFTVVVVAKGGGFSGWDTYLNPTPTPTVTTTPSETPTAPATSWWDSRWQARAYVQVLGTGYERTDKVVETAINFTTKLQEAGLSGALDDSHLRVIETDAAGLVLNEQVPFQFDKDADYQASTKASGQLVLLATGQTGGSATRNFWVYFDTTDNNNGKMPAAVPTLVSYQDNVDYEGQASYRVMTQNATYYYHKLGAGFASMIDVGNSDWLSYHPSGGAAGEYRGLPNIATTSGGQNVGLFHPGYTLSTSSIRNSGPIKVTIKSKTNDNAWEALWEIYPRYAKMTLLRKPADLKYWVLYEGTPGGSISSGDYYSLPDGVHEDVNAEIDTDIAGEEWIYFGDPTSNQVLYVVNHQDDLGLDCHYVMDNAMTVFGFGRDRYSVSNKQLTYAPGYFTVGFTNAAGHQTVKADVYSAYKPIYVGLGAGEATPGLMKAAMAATATAGTPAATAVTQDTTVLNDTGTGDEMLVYDWNKPATRAEHGFLWDVPAADGDGTGRINLAGGTLYYRAEIRNQPLPKPMQLQFCLGQDGIGGQGCTVPQNAPGTPGMVVTWSQKVSDMMVTNDGPIDWRAPGDRGRLAILNSAGRPVSDNSGWNWSGENPDEWYPLDMRFTVVVVGRGGTFSGWDHWIAP